MLSCIAANTGTLIICAVLAGIVALVIAGMLRNKKKGKSSCGCDCGRCPMGGSCHKHEHDEENL